MIYPLIDKLIQPRLKILPGLPPTPFIDRVVYSVDYRQRLKTSRYDKPLDQNQVSRK